MKISIQRSALAAVAVVLLAAPAVAQTGPLAMNGESRAHRNDRAYQMSESLQRGGYAVVVDLDENLLHFRQGRETLWSAPIGTGTGLRLETDANEWDFATPDGVFQVQYKEENPVWIAPDWFFIENDLPIPPKKDPKRYFPGGLGQAAVYIGHDLAIHGTDKEDLLGQRVSHGCIRLANADAQRLFHNVQIGTEVVIVGGETAAAEIAALAESLGNDPSNFDPGESKPRPPDPLLERWASLDTDELVSVMADELWMPDETARWDEAASLLMKRALDDGDDDALAGIIMRAADLPSVRIEREYGTYLTDAFARSPMQMLTVLSELDRDYRDRAAAAIVAASVGLWGGDAAGVLVPWPTRRVPESTVGSDERLGWRALARAEREYREQGQRASI
jgi:lipoprotein-anchoring transpeptidase ErfK/SrfK